MAKKLSDAERMKARGIPFNQIQWNPAAKAAADRNIPATEFVRQATAAAVARHNAGIDPFSISIDEVRPKGAPVNGGGAPVKPQEIVDTLQGIADSVAPTLPPEPSAATTDGREAAAALLLGPGWDF